MKHSDIIDVIIRDNQLILSDQLISLLNAKAGDRITIGYAEKDGKIELEGDGLPIFSDVKKAAEAYITKEIILDTNFNITKLTNYEF